MACFAIYVLALGWHVVRQGGDLGVLADFGQQHAANQSKAFTLIDDDFPVARHSPGYDAQDYVLVAQDPWPEHSQTDGSRYRRVVYPLLIRATEALLGLRGALIFLSMFSLVGYLFLCQRLVKPLGFWEHAVLYGLPGLVVSLQYSLLDHLWLLLMVGSMMLFNRKQMLAGALLMALGFLTKESSLLLWFPMLLFLWAHHGLKASLPWLCAPVPVGIWHLMLVSRDPTMLFQSAFTWPGANLWFSLSAQGGSWFKMGGMILIYAWVLGLFLLSVRRLREGDRSWPVAALLCMTLLALFYKGSIWESFHTITRSLILCGPLLLMVHQQKSSLLTKSLMSVHVFLFAAALLRCATGPIKAWVPYGSLS